MIFWRGWGNIALLFGLAAFAATALICKATGTEINEVTWQALPWFVIAGAGLYVVGQQMNVTKPTQQFADLRALSLGLVPPSPQDPNKADYPMPLDQQPPLSPEEAKTLSRFKNRHTFMFVPIQWLGVLLVLGGIYWTVSGFIR